MFLSTSPRTVAEPISLPVIRGIRRNGRSKRLPAERLDVLEASLCSAGRGGISRNKRLTFGPPG